MSKALLVFLFLVSATFARPVLATEIPELISPPNNSKTNDTSPTLSWKYLGGCPSDPSLYKIEVTDDPSSFKNPPKSVVKNSCTYSPHLSEGEWYWRVSIRDEKGTYSTSSEVHKVTITSIPLATSTPTSTQVETPPSPTTSTTSKQSFTISSTKNSLSESETSPIKVSLTGLQPLSAYFLKTAFYKQESSNYFGFIETNGNWIKNSASYDSQFKLTTDEQGRWSGEIIVKSDPSDTGYNGSGDYFLKIGRYLKKGSGYDGPDWSNSLPFHLSGDKPITSNNDDQTSTTTSTTSVSKPSISTIPLATSSPTLNDLSSDSSPSAEINYQLPNLSPDILGAASESTQPSSLVASDKSFNWWFVAAGLSLLVTSATYLAYQRKIRYHSQ